MEDILRDTASKIEIHTLDEIYEGKSYMEAIEGWLHDNADLIKDPEDRLGKLAGDLVGDIIQELRSFRDKPRQDKEKPSD